MKRFRPLVIATGVLVVLLVLAVGVAYNGSFQTWVTRKLIASQPGMRMKIGRMSAGMKRVELKDLHFEHAGAVLTVPTLAVDLPLFSAGWDKKVLVSQLVAKGWHLDLSRASGRAPIPGAESAALPIGKAGSAPTAPASSSPAVGAAQVFAGVFSQLNLPIDAALDGVELEGDVTMPDSRGRAKVTVRGGGFRAGREGRFDLTSDALLTDPSVNALTVRGHLIAVMDTARTFSRIAARFDASARGSKFPRGVTLQADVTAARAASGETYSVAVVAEGREIVAATADFPRQTPKLSGRWKLDVRDSDLTPFALGHPLPEFVVAGEGEFDADAGFEGIHSVGRLHATVSKLQVIRPELAVLGELTMASDFDLAGRDGTIVVRKFEVTLSTPPAAGPDRAAAADRLLIARIPGRGVPVATIRTLLPFDFNPATGELHTADRAIDLIGVVLQGVPVAWAKPFLTEFDLSGGHVRGELAATARGGGMTLHSTVPITVDGVGLAQAGQPLLQRVDLSLSTSADYTPQGWQAEISRLSAKSGGATVFSLDAKAGQLTGKDQSIKATGRMAASLPLLLAQPGAAGRLALTKGDAAIDFVVSLNQVKEIQAAVALTDLAASTKTGVVSLPALSANIRADIAADGRIVLNAPLVIEQDTRKSDLTFIGTIAPMREKSRSIDAGVTSTHLVVDDARILGAILPEKSDPASSPARDAAPPWAGVHGSLSLQLKHVVYSDTFSASNVTGRLRIDAGMLKLEGLQAGLGETGRASVSGTVTFDASVPQPYALEVDVAVKEFDPVPLFRAAGPDQPATVEGKFDVTTKLTGVAARLGDLAMGAGGSFQLTSKGGVFRGLPVNVSNMAETTSKFAALIASAGTAISAMTGKKDFAEVASRADAVAELVRGLNPIRFDQLSVILSRDQALNTTLKDFTLIAPEVRLSGGGIAAHESGTGLLEDALAMEFTLRARGRQGDLLKYLGALEPQTDDLGYAACTVPLKVGGTLGRPDTSDLNNRLTSLAIEKSGLGEFATELLNRIRGGK